MAINYDSWKQTYSWMNEEQRKKYNDKMQAQWWDVAKMSSEYVNRFNSENNTPQQTSNESNFNNQNGTNWQNSTQNQTPTNPRDKEPRDMTMEEYRKSQTVSPDLDQSKFNEAPWQITVKEWTAQQTGKPDYTISTDARLNEMKGNLDQYFKDSPRMFSDRETFNRVFDYNNRESDAQKQLLDSYWKRKEDMDKASTYTSWEAINNWMKNWEITTDQLNLLKEYNPEAYQKWQQLQEDEIMKRIVNDIVPKTVEEISWKINSMIEALWIQAQDALDIEWIYNDTMAKTWAYQTLEDCNRTVKQIEEVINKKTAIMNRYASSTWWTVSDALAAARMAKAIAPYNEQLQGLQYQYNDYSNLFSQKSATAYQAANVRALQANENQRIWNQKCSALGFATSALSYRTPEEQAELQLKTQQAQNEMQLLQQSRLNDLNRYNTYATTKMQNQLQAELTDLSVEDEQQLKANLNNVLSDYYKNYWDIIQRSQAQVVDDVIAYAKKNWISVAQALSENFIKPLQNKAEYKQKIASDYGMLSKQTITTINWKSVIMTTNPNWSISYQYIEDPDSATSTAKPYDLVDEKVFDVSPQSHSYYTLRDFIDDPTNKEWTYGWQCAKFVNDYLEKIWVGRYFWNEDIKTRASRCNSDVAKVWTIAVFDYNNTSSDWINHWHVGIVVDTDDKGYWVLESNFDKDNPEKISKRYVLNWSSSCKGFFDPSKQPSAKQSTTLSDIDEAKKQNYLEEAKRWWLTATQIWQVWNLAAEQGWGDEWREALKKWVSWNLTDTQIKYMDKTDSTFYSNPIVKEFEEAINQIQQLQVALNDASWVWDMSAIFTFMKTLDPTSVVRESEFNSAAATAWVINPQAIWQSLERSYDWKFLTPQQREDFKKIAVEFIKIKAQNYQTQYNHLANRYAQYWIDVNTRWPANLAEQILTSISWWATWPTTDKEKYFDWLYTPVNTTAGIDYSNASFILG